MSGLALVNLGKQLGGKTVIDNLSMEIQSGELVCLLGASGSGKTTTLRMIGGFIPVDQGRILIDGHDVAHLTPDKRPTGMVFQSYALWPNMDVFQNVAYGLRVRRLPRAEIREKVADVLKLVGLEDHVKKFPPQLSGGQQQRVALARSLVLQPKVLLLDEPLSNLDAKLRERVREDIRRIQQMAGITTVFVTHDQEEALSISDRIAVLEAGRIEQYDTPASLYGRPATRFVATFIGAMNLLSGVQDDGRVTVGPGVTVPCRERPAPCTGAVEFGVRPEDIILSDQGVPAVIARKVPRGHYQELVLQTPFGDLRAFVANDPFVATTTLSDSVKVSFARVSVYQEGRLVESSHALQDGAGSRRQEASIV